MAPSTESEHARALLCVLAREVPSGLVLWRGAELGGSDVDILVMPGRGPAVSRVLREAGLSPAPQNDGRVMWRSFDERRVVIDAMPAASWPPFYPGLEGLLARCTHDAGQPAVASPEDRLLIYGAEALAGRPIQHVLRKAQPLLAVAGARERLRAMAVSEGLSALAELICEPRHLTAAGDGCLRWRRGMQTAVRSQHARAALRARLRARLGRVRPAPPRPSGSGPGLLVALSGIDGSGKSTTAIELAARFEAQGRSAWVSWSRLAADDGALGIIAVALRRLLRREGTIADPVAAGAAPDSDWRRHADGDRGPVEWVWIVLVALANVRSCRRMARSRASGVIVLCDRWLADALVDLDVRYGRHRVAEWVLRRGVPRADLAILLDIDPRTSARRKPGDQAEPVLAAMGRRYDEVARDLGFPPSGSPARGDLMRVDATNAWPDVVARVERAVRGRLHDGLRVRLMTSHRLDEADIAAWERLADGAAEPNPFFRPQFVIAAAEKLGEPAGLLVVSDHAGWRACVPLRRSSRLGRLALPCLVPWLSEFAFLGTPLVDGDRMPETAAALAGWWAAQRRALALVFGPTNPDGPVARALRTAFAARGLAPEVYAQFERAGLQRRPEPTYLDAVSPKRLKELRRLRRRLGEQLGAPLRVTDRSDEPGAFETFLALESDSWKGDQGTALRRLPGGAEFFRAMCAQMAARDGLQILALEGAGRTVAMQCNLLEGEIMFCFKVAYDHALGRFSPGALLEIDAIEIFHEQLSLTSADSCADPDNALINTLWPDRRRMELMLVTSGPYCAALLRRPLRVEQAAR